MNHDEVIRSANIAVLESSIAIGQLTEEVLVLRKVVSKIPNAAVLIVETRQALLSEGVLPLPSVPTGTA